ncbi:MAG: S9 family peptidase [Acidobacteriota bacterium]|nr:S9 family peptidase [Acidobacteriota bacterium]
MVRALATVLVLAGLAAAAQKPVTLEAVKDAPAHSTPKIVWAADGERFVVNEKGQILLYEVRSGKERVIVDMDKLQQAAVPNPAPAVFDWTNRHVGEREIQWFADGRRLLVAAAGDLFIVDVPKGRFEPLTQTSEAERDPKLSPDNRFVSFRRGPDLYTLEIASKAVTRLTTSGTDTLLNGQTDWVYPEELDLDTAHWWSPDSRSIAYLQFDTAREPVYPQVSLLNVRGVVEPERYPKAGEPNAEVRLGIVPATGGATKWMDFGDPRDQLPARVVWAPNSQGILAERLNRVQNKLDLLLADTATGISHAVLHEEDPQWINVRGEPRFLANGRQFVWTSERTGFRHIYLCGIDGKTQEQLTAGNWEVGSIAGIDEARRRVLFISNEESPTQAQLYAVGLEGGTRQRLTKTAGVHAISLAPGAAYYMDDWNSLTNPPRRTLFKGDGDELREFRAPDAAAAGFEILPAEIVQLKAADGTVLYGRLIKPAGFDPAKKYPAIAMVYGGPGVQSVRDAWSGVSWEQALAQRGFVVWQLDNRGSAGRGHKFEAVVYRDLGEHELNDQKAGLAWLTGRGFVDPARIGLYGWSYGGFMTLYTITRAPGLIQAAIAGAPVTNWRNYDSIYTERYMGLPQENPEAYERTSPIPAAAAMEGTKLLMIHNIEDDNVHFQNSVQMAEALEQAGKKFFMLVYPQKTHGVGGLERKQLLEAETAFFEDNLK